MNIGVHRLLANKAKDIHPFLFAAAAATLQHTYQQRNDPDGQGASSQAEAAATALPQQHHHGKRRMPHNQTKNSPKPAEVGPLATTTKSERNTAHHRGSSTTNGWVWQQQQPVAWRGGVRSCQTLFGGARLNTQLRFVLANLFHADLIDGFIH